MIKFIKNYYLVFVVGSFVLGAIFTIIGWGVPALVCFGTTFVTVVIAAIYSAINTLKDWNK